MEGWVYPASRQAQKGRGHAQFPSSLSSLCRACPQALASLGRTALSPKPPPLLQPAYFAKTHVCYSCFFLSTSNDRISKSGLVMRHSECRRTCTEAPSTNKRTD